MRFVMIIAAAVAAMCLAVPAQAAQLFQFEYSAYAVGQQTVYDPNGQFCGSHPLGCLGSAPFAITISGTTMLYNDTGTGTFEVGSFCANCTGWSGNIVGGFINGVQQFNGINFIYTSGNPTIIGSARATAATFYVRLLSVDGVPVRGPVPEPATWLMLILGFAAISGALRERKHQALHGLAIA